MLSLGEYIAASVSVTLFNSVDFVVLFPEEKRDFLLSFLVVSMLERTPHKR